MLNEEVICHLLVLPNFRSKNTEAITEDQKANYDIVLAQIDLTVNNMPSIPLWTIKSILNSTLLKHGG